MDDFDAGVLKKTAGKFKIFADNLSKLDKLISKGKYNPFLVGVDLQKLRTKIPQGDDITGVLQGGAELIDQLKTRVEHQQSAQKIAIVNELANGLSAHGLKVSGQLPMLMAGPFNLMFDFGANANVKVYLGNKAYMLGKVALDVPRVVEMVLNKYNELFVKEFDAPGFVRDLLNAYKHILEQERQDPGFRVKISGVMFEYVMQKQRKSFFVDPRRENFDPIQRVEFACMMYRAVGNRRAGEWEMRLDVAAMGDTKDPLDHIWIPQGLHGEGVNYTTMRFVRRGHE